MDNPKSELINFLQRHCGRTLSKADVIWNTSGAQGAFQCNARLVCLDGQEFAGDVAPTEKAAEQAAARVALEAFSAEIAALPVKQPKKKEKKSASLFDPTDNALMLQKLAGQNGNPAMDDANNFKNQLIKALQTHCKRPMAKGDIVYEHNRIGNMTQATARLECVGGMAFAGEPMVGDKAAEQSAAQQAILSGASWGMPVEAAVLPVAQAPKKGGGPDPANPKSELVMFLQGYLKKTMTKNEVSYTVTTEGNMSQAILTVGPMDGQQFAGEPCQSVKEAENSAASQALAAYAPLFATVPSLAKLAAKRALAGVGEPAGKRLKGGALGALGVIAPAGKGKGYAAGGVRPPTAKGPAVAGPRTDVTLAPVTGEVTEWNTKASFGYIKPHQPIGHAMENQRGGKIYVHKQDLSNTTALTPGAMVQFTVYSDAKGLGCANVMQF